MAIQLSFSSANTTLPIVEQRSLTLVDTKNKILVDDNNVTFTFTPYAYQPKIDKLDEIVLTDTARLVIVDENEVLCTMVFSDYRDRVRYPSEGIYVDIYGNTLPYLDSDFKDGYALSDIEGNLLVDMNGVPLDMLKPKLVILVDPFGNIVTNLEGFPIHYYTE